MFLFVYLFCHKACGILVPQPGFKPTSHELEGEVLTARETLFSSSWKATSPIRLWSYPYDLILPQLPP